MTQWHGPIPAECDICADPIVDEFIDGATQMGPWANMCVECFRTLGVGIGSGRGQRYKRRDEKIGVPRFVKVAG